MLHFCDLQLVSVEEFFKVFTYQVEPLFNKLPCDAIPFEITIKDRLGDIDLAVAEGCNILLDDNGEL